MEDKLKALAIRVDLQGKKIEEFELVLQGMAQIIREAGLLDVAKKMLKDRGYK